MNCPLCNTAMTRGGVSMRNSPWRLGSASFTGDLVDFESIPTGEVAQVLRNGWVRDAYRCSLCEAVVIFDGRKTGPVE